MNVVRVSINFLSIPEKDLKVIPVESKHSQGCCHQWLSEIYREGMSLTKLRIHGCSDLHNVVYQDLQATEMHHIFT